MTETASQTVPQVPAAEASPEAVVPAPGTVAQPEKARPPKVLHCSKCKFTTDSIDKMGRHHQAEHPKEPADPGTAQPEWEELPMKELDEIRSGLQDLAGKVAGLDERTTALASHVVPLPKVQESIQAAVSAASEHLRGPEKLPEAKDPKLEALVAKADVLTSICERFPELCAVLDKAKAGAVEIAAAVEADPHVAHQQLLEALDQAGKRILGRHPSWGDLLDPCPDGKCGLALAKSVAKRPDLLKELLAEDESAAALVAALTETGKFVIAPVTPPGSEEVPSGPGRGFFGRRE